MNHVLVTLTALYALLALGGRSYLQRRRTGSFGIRIGSKSRSQRIGGGVLAAGFALALGSVILGAALEPPPLLAIPGWVLFGAGFAGTLASQIAMGASWRIGVDPEERTTLVTAGPFSLVRNPIFTSVIVLVLGIACLAPNEASAAGALLTVAGVEIQVRFVEEPYLVAIHGARYEVYAGRVGRFLPRVGRLRRNTGSAA
jgi:protein-S-isoprenylcysteine O-methyltransferase Ste14